jgi:hypothetical protein
VFWVISVYFNIRNTLPKSGPFLLLHPVYVIRRLKVNGHMMILHYSTMTETSVSKRLNLQLVGNEDFISKLIVQTFNIFQYGEASQVSLPFLYVA